jgi:hypothetical protein
MIKLFRNIRQKPIAETPIVLSATKRNWSSYFKEFFMLFLAVFCGFLAENYRDSLSERQREKQFITSYIEDVKLDTAAITTNLQFQKTKRVQLDSLLYFIREQKIMGNEGEIYYIARLLVRTRRFQSTDRTISQLKSSGSMRLIKNETAVDSIIAYQKLVETILTNIEDDRTERRAMDPLLAKVFNPFVFDDMLDNTNTINKPIGNPPLRSYNPDLHQDLAYGINQIKGSNIILKTRLELLHQKATNVILFLKKEYNVRD